MKTSDNNLVPLFEPATDSPALSLFFQLPISVASFQFCLIDVEVALFSVEMDHPMCLYIDKILTAWLHASILRSCYLGHHAILLRENHHMITQIMAA